MLEQLKYGMMEQLKDGKMVQLKFRVMEKPQDGMMEQLKDSIIGLVLKINRWSQTQTPRRSDDDYDDRQNSCYYQQMQGVSLLINTTYLLCSAIKRNLQTQVGLKFLREVLIRQHQSQFVHLRVFTAFKNVTKVLKIRDGTFSGLTKVLKPQSF